MSPSLWITLAAVLILVSISLVAAVGTKYEFVFENDEIFDECADMENVHGVHDLFDTSNLQFQFNEGSITISGEVKCLWEGVQPTDRIENRVELLKYVRGAWQPTPFSMFFNNFCDIFYDEKNLYYRLWTKNILEEDRKCFNVYMHVLRHRTFEVDTIIEFPVKMDGQHKLVIHYIAYDENNVKRPIEGCFEIHGEFFKVK
ncbi:uncharacterized protein LOC133334538 [Musca vetustissima]|uniref:uncharacterized protein LOC133334538 n=1 Tax=Musca vetustissima TaxID=27455 RepID=UPI002AB69213|nr:uncharacterized protein LOC133334538 [Musca vetustissima]